MKTIGLIGGMSWESSIEYYRMINEIAMKKLGGFHSAKSIMYSVDFADIETLQREARWTDAGQILGAAAKSLENSGADFIVLCTNTMHKVADKIEASINIPFLHIADPTASRIKEAGFQNIGLLGTRFTMEQDFYKGRLAQKYGLNVQVPDEKGRDIIHRVIYEELVLGKIEQRSKEQYLDVMQELVQQGAEAVILGCTEIGLLIHSEDSDVPLFDTTIIHAEAAVEYALN